MCSFLKVVDFSKTRIVKQSFDFRFACIDHLAFRAPVSQCLEDRLCYRGVFDSYDSGRKIATFSLVMVYLRNQEGISSRYMRSSGCSPLHEFSVFRAFGIIRTPTEKVY